MRCSTNLAHINHQEFDHLYDKLITICREHPFRSPDIISVCTVSYSGLPFFDLVSTVTEPPIFYYRFCLPLSSNSFSNIH
jgi:hypothetical protein